MDKKNNKLNIIKKVAIYVASFIVLFLTLMTSVISPKYSIKEGEIAKYDIKAPREIKDEEATREKFKQIEDQVNDQYVKDNEVKNKAIESIDTLFITLNGIDFLLMADEEKINKLRSSSPIQLSEEDYTVLASLAEEDLKVLQGFMINVINEIYDNNRIENKDEDIAKAQGAVLSKFNSSNLSNTLKNVGTHICYTQIVPNFFLDKEKTEAAKKESTKDIDTIIIKKDQIIVKYGEPVTAKQIELLKQLGLLNEKSAIQWKLYISLGVLILIIMSLQWFYLFKYYRKVYQDNKSLILINFLSCIALLLARTIGMISVYLIPLACIPLLLTLLINYKISLVISALNIILISGTVGFNIEVTILAILNTVMGAVVLRKMQARNDVFISTVFIAVVNVICTFSIGVLLSNNTVEVLMRAGIACVGSIISAVFTVGLLPFFESTFDIVTVMKLLELGNPNQPLLKRLLMETPGTYHHSILVANLAEVAADEVGANSVLARVGAYYHDVGKIKRPYFFKENQVSAENPHNKITPSLSAAVIISHVMDGVEIAKAHRIPKCILEFIEQHHGNSLVKYFYITMKNTSENPESIKEDDFRYLGPIPRSKETAIVMLADSVEAAVRSVNEPSIDKIEAMVHKIFKDKLDDGQLNGCELTFRDLEKIKRIFLKTLSGIYHQRIEYPEEKRVKEIEEKDDDLH